MSSKRLDVRMSDTLFEWITLRAKLLGFATTSAYVRWVFEELRLKHLKQ